MSSKHHVVKIEPRTVQKYFLKAVDKARKKGAKKGVLILATGLGKTFSAFLDAVRYDGRILVVAHRQEILQQLEKDFKKISDRKTGFLYSSKKDIDADVLFANSLTLKNRTDLFSADEFDYIIVDETHHAAAKSYKCLFNYFTPKFLLGITATPDRTDRKCIVSLYDENILMEISRDEAVNKGWLRKYKYVFLWDKWCNYDDVDGYWEGTYKKYNIKSLSKKYNVPERDSAIVKEFKDRAKDRKGIAFCVSVKETIRMANLFNNNNIKSIAIHGGLSPDKRKRIMKDFAADKYQVLFNCEIIGEGIHLPAVDVVLKLRPTISCIKDNQHNGRGLINIETVDMSKKKYEKLLILDWVGNYKNAYLNYVSNEERMRRSNISSKRRTSFDEIMDKPLGCEVEFDPRVIKLFNAQALGKYITKKMIRKQFLKFKEEHGRLPSTRDIRKYNLYSDNTVRARFGSFAKCIEELGGSVLKYTSVDLPEKRLMDDYLMVKKKLKRIPLGKEVDDAVPYSFRSALLNNFNKTSYLGFLKYVGDYEKYIQQNTKLQHLTKQQTINEYKKLKDGHYYKKPPVKLNYWISKYFGGIKNLRKEMGEDPVLNWRYVSRVTALERFYNVMSTIGRVPKTGDMNMYGFSILPYHREWGSWKKFLRSQGFEAKSTISGRKKVISSSERKSRKCRSESFEEYKEEYFRVKELLGKVPTYQELSKNSKLALGAWSDNVFRDFGNGYRFFLEKIGETPNIVTYSKKEIVEKFKELEKQLDKTPRIKDFGVGINGEVFRKKWGGYGNFLKSIGREKPRPSRYVSDTTVIENFYNMKETLGRIPLFSETMHTSLIARRWGGYKQFLESLGFNAYDCYRGSEYEKHYWTDKDIVDEYYRVKGLVGRTPMLKDFTGKGHVSKMSEKIIRNRFGTFNKFKKSLGEETYQEHIQNRCSEEDLVKYYNKVKQRLGRPPKHRDLKTYNPKLFMRVLNKRNWKDVRSFMGDPIVKVTHSDFTKNYFDIKKRLGRMPTSQEYAVNSKNGLGLGAISKTYNGYNNFLDKLGEKKPVRKMVEHDFISEYKALQKKLGKKYIGFHEFSKHSTSSSSTVKNRFGSWVKFLKKCGVEPKYRERNTSEKDLINQYLFVKSKIKRIPTINDINNQPYSYSQFLKVFGSYSALLKKMGDYEESMKQRSIRSGKKNRLIKGRKIKEVKRRYLDGESVAGISKSMGCSSGPVANALRHAGIKLRGVAEQRMFMKNIRITSTYKSKSTAPQFKSNKKKVLHSRRNKNLGNWVVGYKDKDNKKQEIREKIIGNIADGDDVLLLESPELSAIKEIERQGITPKRIVIPNNLEFKKIRDSLQHYETNLKIELINASALQYLVDNDDSFDFLWLDYCGGFTYYTRDIDTLFQKRFTNMKLVITCNIFDVAKDDDSFYFTKVIDYVLGKTVGYSVRLLNDVTYRYKKNMYNVGFNIQELSTLPNILNTTLPTN